MNGIFAIFIVIGALIVHIVIGFFVIALLIHWAERAMDRLIGYDGHKEVIAWLIWPITLTVALLMQFHPRYRGRQRPVVQYKDK